MPLWAMIDVAMRSHPKLFGRPDCDFRLWTCLVLHAKEHAALDGVIRGLTPADLRAQFGIKAPLKMVEAALDYFAGCPLGPMIRRDPDGAIALLGWSDSGNAYDEDAEREAWRTRKARQRSKAKPAAAVPRDFPRDQTHGGSPGGPAANPDKSQNVPRDVTPRSRDGHANVPPLEGEVEGEVEKKNRGDSAESPPPPPASDPPDPPAESPKQEQLPSSDDAEVIAKLEADWTPDLVARVKVAVSSSRASGRMSPGPWRGFLARAAQFAKPQREAAAQLYLDRAHGPDGKGEAYLVGMMRNNAGAVGLPGLPPRGAPFNPRIDPNAHAVPGRKKI